MSPLKDGSKIVRALFGTSMLSKKLGARPLFVGPDAHLRGLSHVRMGRNFSSGRGLWLQAVTEHGGEKFSPQIIIGDDVSVSFWGHIAATNYVEIGSNVLIGSKVIITDHNHGLPTDPFKNIVARSSPRRLDCCPVGRVVIGRNVWIGDGVVIGPGAEIGEGCIIGANAVVNKDLFRAYTIAVGIPAKPIKRYDLINRDG